MCKSQMFVALHLHDVHFRRKYEIRKANYINLIPTKYSKLIYEKERIRKKKERKSVRNIYVLSMLSPQLTTLAKLS